METSDTTTLIRLLQETMPHEIYNLGVQSHVQKDMIVEMVRSDLKVVLEELRRISGSACV
jgi:GDP-D-mannose dehydratase